MITILKRNNQKDFFQPEKIAIAIKKGFDSVENENYTMDDVHFIYQQVLTQIETSFQDNEVVTIEQIQDVIEKQLIKHRYQDVYESFSSYRLSRNESRAIFIAKQHKFLKAIEKFSYSQVEDPYQAFEKLLAFGKNVSTEFTKSYLIEQQSISLHDQGKIYIQSIDSYPMGSLYYFCVDPKTITHMDTFSFCQYLIALYKETLSILVLNQFDQYADKINFTDFNIFLDSISFPIWIETSDENILKFTSHNKHIHLLTTGKIINPTLSTHQFEHSIDFENNPFAINCLSINLTRFKYYQLPIKELIHQVETVCQHAIQICIDRFHYQCSKTYKHYPLLSKQKFLSTKKDAMKKFLLKGTILIDIVGLANFTKSEGDKILKQIQSTILEYQSPQIPKIILTTLFTKEAANHFMPLDQSIFGEISQLQQYHSIAKTNFTIKPFLFNHS